MKKIIFFVSLFACFFIFGDSVYALEFTATNGKNYTVDSPETLRDYCYYKNKNYFSNSRNTPFAVFSETFGSRTTYYCYLGFTSSYFTNNTIYFKSSFAPNGTSFTADFSDWNPISNYSINNISSIYYSNIDIMSSKDSTDVYFSSNFLPSDIEKKYGKISKYSITYYLNNEVFKKIDEVEEGSSHDLISYDYNPDLYKFSGWSVDNNSDLTNITSDIVIRATLEEKAIMPVYVKNFNEFPITKNEFYALLILQGVSIVIVFLKWCYPFKGGTDF